MRGFTLRTIAVVASVSALLCLAGCGAAGPSSAQTDLLPAKVQYNVDGTLKPLPPMATPDGVSITLLAIERHPSKLLFHFKVESKATETLQLLTSDPGHKFVLVGAKPAGTPADVGVVDLTAPVQADRADHPALSDTIGAKAVHDGWLAADLTALGYPPQTLMYRYNTMHTTMCKDRADPSTCVPADLYQVIEWEL